MVSGDGAALAKYLRAFLIRRRRRPTASGQSGEMSLPPDERKVRDPMKRRTKFVAVAAAFAVASGGGVAYALWSANGSGPGQTKA